MTQNHDLVLRSKNSKFQSLSAATPSIPLGWDRCKVVLSVSPKHGAIVEWPTGSSFKVGLKVGQPRVKRRGWGHNGLVVSICCG